MVYDANIITCIDLPAAVFAPCQGEVAVSCPVPFAICFTYLFSVWSFYRGGYWKSNALDADNCIKIKNLHQNGHPTRCNINTKPRGRPKGVPGAFQRRPGSPSTANEGGKWVCFEQFRFQNSRNAIHKPISKRKHEQSRFSGLQASRRYQTNDQFIPSWMNI